MKSCITRETFDQNLPAMGEQLWEKAKRLSALPALSFDELDPADTLIISVDINCGFAVEGALCSKEAGEMIEPTAALLRQAKERGFSTLAFSDRHTDASPELKSFPPHCVAGTGEEELPEVMRPYVDRLIYKNSTNALLAPESWEVLAPYRRFVITGCLTEFCIFHFATALRSLLNEQNRADSEVIVPLSLIDTYDAPGHNALLYNLMFADGMAQAGVRLVSHLG